MTSLIVTLVAKSYLVDPLNLLLACDTSNPTCDISNVHNVLFRRLFGIPHENVCPILCGQCRVGPELKLQLRFRATRLVNDVTKKMFCFVKFENLTKIFDQDFFSDRQRLCDVIVGLFGHGNVKAFETSDHCWRIRTGDVIFVVVTCADLKSGDA